VRHALARIGEHTHEVLGRLRNKAVA
jgi:hypothetical protein